jgi:hypothetical protein
MKTLSVVVSSHNRAALLDRALATYARQTLPSRDWEYLLVDDFSTDHTREVVEAWQARGLPITRLDAGRDLSKREKAGDGAAPRNAGSLFATGRYLVSTHPEILIPPHTLQAMVEALKNAPDRAWVTAIPYWLPPVPEEWWDGWQGGSYDIERLKTIPGFYDPTWPTPVAAPGAIDYRNQNQETRREWESEVFWGMSMATWRWLGGFREFRVWGSVDIDFWVRRRMANIQTFLAMHPNSCHESKVLMVYHPHHDSDRNMEQCLASLQAAGDYTSVEQMRKAGGLYHDYNHGHRERAAVPGTTEGVMEDHLERYRWAKQFCDNKRVLDVPCGTGYGASVLRNGDRCARAYVGVDLDAESVDTAASYVVDPKHDLFVDSGRVVLVRGHRAHREPGRRHRRVRTAPPPWRFAAHQHTAEGRDTWDPLRSLHADARRVPCAV